MPKKSSKGCLTVLLVLGAIAGLICLVGGFFAWRASQDPELQKVLGAVTKGAQVVVKGTKAPGAEELRGAGCQQALVLSVSEMMEAASEFIDAGALDELNVGVALMCQVPLRSGAPDCAKLAQVYVKAAKPTEAFMVTVRATGDQKPVCDASFDATGQPQEK